MLSLRTFFISYSTGSIDIGVEFASLIQSSSCKDIPNLPNTLANLTNSLQFRVFQLLSLFLTELEAG
jgi:hypothetical protein